MKALSLCLSVDKCCPQFTTVQLQLNYEALQTDPCLKNKVRCVQILVIVIFHLYEKFYSVIIPVNYY